MKTSNVELLAEIDTLEEIKRVDANKLECVKLIQEQADAKGAIERLNSRLRY